MDHRTQTRTGADHPGGNPEWPLSQRRWGAGPCFGCLAREKLFPEVWLKETPQELCAVPHGIPSRRFWIGLGKR